MTEKELERHALLQRANDVYNMFGFRYAKSIHRLNKNRFGRSENEDTQRKRKYVDDILLLRDKDEGIV